MRTDRIKNHFEEEAKQYETIIRKLKPTYYEMVDTLVSMIPFSKVSLVLWYNEKIDEVVS